MATMKDGGPAFPGRELHGDSYPGMSLRDWFAGQALAGSISGAQNLADAPDAFLVEYARLLYRVADSMLKVRDNG
jgi:hypothetical protein